VDFVNECVRTKRGHAFRSSEIIAAFKEWFLEYNTSYSSKIVPKIDEVLDYMNSKFETSDQGGVWFNVEIISENDDDEKDEDYVPSDEEEESSEEEEESSEEDDESSEEDEESSEEDEESSEEDESEEESESESEDGDEGEEHPDHLSCNCNECIRYLDGWNGGWTAAMKHIGKVIEQDSFIQKPTRCSNCRTFFSYLMSCSGSCNGSEKYCSYICQKDHWSETHKYECKRYE